MPPPLRRTTKASLLKLFILDEQGGYAGEYVVDNECVVEYGDILGAVPEEGLGDQESVYLGEYRATAFHGNRLSLIGISRGPLTPEDLVWMKAALVATEAHLTGTSGPQPTTTEPDKAVMESLVSALEKREMDLVAREKSLVDTIEQGKREADEARRPLEADIKALRARVAELEAERAEARRQLEAEYERLRKDTPKAPQAAAATPGTAHPEREQLERDRKMLQQRALGVLDREERLRARESELAAEADRLATIRQEHEALLARIEDAKKSPVKDFDVEAARKEIDMRVKILQRKALDLLDREERLREREVSLQRAQTAPIVVTAPTQKDDEETA